MNDTVRLGRVAGIPIGVNWTVLAVGWLIGWSLAGRLLPRQVPGLEPPVYWFAALVVAVLFLASLLAHELAHAVVARRNGLVVDGITLWLLGGMARLQGEAASPGAEARIAIVGPLTSLGVAGVAFVAAVLLEPLEPRGAAALVVVSAQWLAVVNVLLAVFNLLPGAPLDGGRVAKAIVWAIRGDRLAATRVASRIGRGLGYALAAFGVLEIVVGADVGGLWSIVLGIFLASAAGVERRQAETLDALEGLLVLDVMTRDPMRAPASLTADAFVEHILPGARTSTFLLTGPDGEPAALLPVERLGRLRRSATRDVRLASLGTPLREVPHAGPAEELVAVLDRLDVDGSGARAVVEDEDGAFAGLVLPEDVARAIEAGRRRPRSARGRTATLDRAAPETDPRA